MRIPLSQIDSWMCRHCRTMNTLHLYGICFLPYFFVSICVMGVSHLAREVNLFLPKFQFRNRFPHPSLIILYTLNLPTVYGICVGDFEVGLCLLPKPRSETSSHVTKSSAAFPVQFHSSHFDNCVGNTFGKSQSFPDSLDPRLEVSQPPFDNVGDFDSSSGIHLHR